MTIRGHFWLVSLKLIPFNGRTLWMFFFLGNLFRTFSTLTEWLTDQRFSNKWWINNYKFLYFCVPLPFTSNQAQALSGNWFLLFNLKTGSMNRTKILLLLFSFSFFAVSHPFYVSLSHFTLTENEQKNWLASHFHFNFFSLKEKKNKDTP